MRLNNPRFRDQKPHSVKQPFQDALSAHSNPYLEDSDEDGDCKNN